MARKKRPRKLRPRTPARVRKKRRASGSGSSGGLAGHHRPELAGLALVALGVFLGACLWGSWNGGSVGAWLARNTHDLLGAAAYVMPVALVGVGGLMLVRSSLVDFRPFRLGLAATALGLGFVLGADHGGWYGEGIDAVLGRAIGSTGLMILGVFTLLAGVLLLTGASVGAIVRRSHHAVRIVGRSARDRLDRPQHEPGSTLPQGMEEPDAKPPPVLVDAVQDYPDIVSSEENVYEPEPVLVADLHEVTEDTQESLFDLADAPAPEYRLPDRAILRRSKVANGSSAEQSARTAELLVRTLSHFGVEATVVGEISGPRVTRYELQLAAGTKVSKVAGLKDDLSYALATTEIRILAPIPGKQAVGVEVPNTSPNLVTLGDVFDDLPQAVSPLSVWLGKDISGNAVWADLARMPHILIAGTTGSGKSGCLNAMLTSILLRSTPDDVRMIMIDPKRIELGYYESIPHLLTSVVSNAKQAAAALTNVVAEMEKRYERMSLMRARSLPELNRTLRARKNDPLPYLLVVIDDLAAGGRGGDHPARAEVPRRRHSSRAGDAAAVRGRDHRHDQGERAEPDRVRRLESDRLPRDSRPGRRRVAARPGRHALQAAR